ncbi:class I SAM-dependent methyltransferase [Muricoccus aerilatus]|uniref:class I SAM-dependent methyltransferase n=1 Tax=Muricoccus aerilatus TaxID=452982 RepID=UPI000694D4D3|nr:class I SAM-dependent methyltransferase [Roseomonas aerilata]
MLSLDDLGIVQGTDKSSACHGYLKHYERLFAPWQHAPITLVEIGVFDGASLRTWRQFFSRARIVGLDIDRSCLKHAAEGIEVVIGSQTDAAFLDEVARWTRPNIIIDDGSHQADHIMFTFEHMFRHLVPGGCYVIEDLNAHVGPNASYWRGTAECPPTDHFGRFFGEVATRQRADIERIEAFPSAVAIWKSARTNLDAVEARVAQLLESGEATAESFYRQALFLRDRGKIGPAEVAIARAIEMDSTRPWYHTAREDILARAQARAAAE